MNIPPELIEFYTLFHRSGLSSLAEWGKLEDQDRAALVVARDQVEHERLERLCTALTSPFGAVAASTHLDAGEALSEARMGWFIRSLV